MNPRITEISTGFPHGRIFLYLIRGDRNTLVDTGMHVTPERDIAPVLASFGLSLSDIHLILNTHGHFDHTGGNHAVKKAGNARILIHKDEAPMVNHRKRYLDDFFAPMVKGVLGEEHLEMDWGNFVGIAGPETSVDGFLEDNDKIDLGPGCELRVLHLPGHTSGSLGFYWEKEGILFSGDSLSGLHDAGGGLPILMDLDAYQASVKRVCELPVSQILMAHDYRGLSLQPSNVRQGGEVNLHLQDCMDVAQSLFEAISAVPAINLNEPVIRSYDQVIARLPKNMGFKKLEETFVPALSAEVILFTRQRKGEH